jgi:hypothetical protein
MAEVMPWEEGFVAPKPDETAQPVGHETINQDSKQPTQKVGLGVGLGGGFILGIQLWLRERFGINLLDVEVGLLTWLFTFGAAYFVKERNRQKQ